MAKKWLAGSFLVLGLVLLVFLVGHSAGEKDALAGYSIWSKIINRVTGLQTLRTNSLSLCTCNLTLLDVDVNEALVSVNGELQSIDVGDTQLFYRRRCRVLLEAIDGDQALIEVNGRLNDYSIGGSYTGIRCSGIK